MSKEATQLPVSKWATREAYFFNHGASIAAWAIYLSLNLGMVVWGTWEFTAPHWTTTNDILRVTLPIARAGGRVVTFNTAIILITASKYVWTLVRAHTVIPLGFPVDDIMPKYHRIVALFLIFSGCIVHTIPQIVNYAMQEIKILDDVPVWTFGDGFSTKQLLYTGVLLFVILATFFFTTLKKVRNTSLGFRLFWLFHVVGISMVFPLLLIHGTIRGHPILFYFSLGPIALYVADCVIRRFVFLELAVPVREWSTHEENEERVTKLVVDCPSFRYTPGQYADLNIPDISKYEWHPFTIASAPSKEDCKVTFYIKGNGRWTNQLCDIVQSDAGNELRPKTIVHIRGPHGAPAQNYLMYQHLIVIGSGIGVTPLLSIWRYLINKTPDLVCEQPVKNLDPNKWEKCEQPQPLWVEESEEVRNTVNIDNVDVCTMEKVPLISTQGKSAYYASVLESITVNVCLFCFSVITETVVFSVWIFGFDSEAAILQLVVSLVALIVFGSKVLLSLLAYGPLRYGQSFVCWLEVSIVLLDLGAMASSFMTLNEPTREAAISYFSFFAAFVCVHGGRIFHIFYATARPPPSMAVNEPMGNKIYSIKGVWVSRYYSTMRFAAMDLVNTLKNASPVFSLSFYGTREKDDVTSSGRHTTVAGRPDWRSIFREGIERAHATNPEGEPVGVYFCGSPAIARELQRVAQAVTAEHQHFTKHQVGSPCNCRILVHKENF